MQEPINEHEQGEERSDAVHPGFRRNRLSRGLMGRRGLMAGVGATALTLPFLRALSSKAQGRTAPKRLLVVFSPNGTIPDAWRPSGGERDFTFGRILEPLEPFREHVTVVGNMDMRTRSSGPGDGHQKGMGEMLTGVDLLPGDTGGGCDSCAAVSWAGGISIDQHIANSISEGTPFRSVELGSQVGGSNIWTRMIYSGPGEPLPPETNPFNAFSRLFGELDADPFGEEQRRLEQQSVLDAVLDDFASLSRRLGRDDQEKLASHMEMVRELERRLESTGGGFGASCMSPELGAEFDVNDAARFPEVIDLQADIVTAAFACDLTRVASIQWNRSVGQLAHPWAGVNDRHHDLSHLGDGDTAGKNKLIEINRWYAERFADILGKMASVDEGEGKTLLDNTLIVWCNELGKGNSHTPNDIPFVLGGHCGGALEGGRWVQYDRPHNDLLLSMANAFGLEDTQFGDERFNEGPLDGLFT